MLVQVVGWKSTTAFLNILGSVSQLWFMNVQILEENFKELSELCTLWGCYCSETSKSIAKH